METSCEGGTYPDWRSNENYLNIKWQWGAKIKAAIVTVDKGVYYMWKEYRVSLI